MVRIGDAGPFGPPGVASEWGAGDLPAVPEMVPDAAPPPVPDEWAASAVPLPAPVAEPASASDDLEVDVDLSLAGPQESADA